MHSESWAANRGWRLAVLASLITAGVGCRSHGAQIVEQTGAGNAVARVRFHLHRTGTAERHPLSSVVLYFDDGRGQRMVPGEVMGVPPNLQRFMPDSGHFATLSTGTMHVRAVLLSRTNRLDTLAVASTSVPLQSDWLWTISVTIGTPSGLPGFSASRLDTSTSVPVRDSLGRATGEQLVLRANGNSWSRPVEP